MISLEDAIIISGYTGVWMCPPDLVLQEAKRRYPGEYTEEYIKHRYRQIFSADFLRLCHIYPDGKPGTPEYEQALLKKLTET